MIIIAYAWNMIIIGIDPGTATTGYGIIRKLKNKKPGGPAFKCLAFGVIKTTPDFSSADRLKIINGELNKLMRKFKPNVLAVENVFFFKNLKTVIPVSQAKGIILFTAAKLNVPVYEFSPLQIKKSLVNYGWAEKEEVQKKVKKVLRLKEIPRSDDAADALATAICCAKVLDN